VTVRWLAALALLLLASCLAVRDLVDDRAYFERWVAATPERAAAFSRFEAQLQAANVGDVVPAYQLWMVDQLRPECAPERFWIPPEEEWSRIVPALVFIRDHVRPVIGEVRVVSGYRAPEFNACIRGAPQSAHRQYQALDLVPLNRALTRERLIELLCPVHAAAGAQANVGLGIYAGVRFHIDARGFRGWGSNYHRTTFPCDGARRADLDDGGHGAT